MQRIISLLLLSPLFANAFSSYRPMQPRNGMQLQMSTEAEAGVALTITGNNIDLTPALQDHVEKRIGRPLNKLGGDGVVMDCEVHLSVYKNPKVRKGHSGMSFSIALTTDSCHNILATSDLTTNSSCMDDIIFFSCYDIFRFLTLRFSPRLSNRSRMHTESTLQPT